MGELDRLGDLLPPEASGRSTKTPVRSGGGSGGMAGAPAQGSGSEEELARRVAIVWTEEVGPEIAANARPVQLRNGRLVVTTSSSSWAQTLQLMSAMVVERLNHRLGEGSVERAVFRHAGWDPTWNADAATCPPGAAVSGTGIPAAATVTGPTAPTPAAPLLEEMDAPSVPSATSESGDFSPEEQRALAEVDGLPLPAAVRQTIRQAMIADFVHNRQNSGRS